MFDRSHRVRPRSVGEQESLAAAALGAASDTMMAHPLALQLRNLQTLAELGVGKNSTVVFPAPLMSTISELGVFLAKETASIESIDALMQVSGAMPAPVEHVPPRTPVPAG